LRLALVTVASGCAGAPSASASLTSPAASHDPGSFIPVGDPGLVLLREIRIGDCFNQNVGTDGRSHGFALVPCSDSHQLEMFGRGDIDSAQSEYPGADILAADADRICRPLFEGYVGMNYDDSKYTYWSYDPHPEDWPGDRTIHCALGNAALTAHDSGTVKGSGQ